MELGASMLPLIFAMLFISVESQNWTHHIILDAEGVYHLYWTPPENKKGDSEITFKTEVKAKGCFSLGFSPDGKIPGSDIVIGWIKDGEIYFQDRHGSDAGMFIKDSQQDYKLITAYENETSTVFEFSRKLNTCDENDAVIDESSLKALYAYSEEDPVDDPGDDSFYPKEEFGSKGVLLLQYNIIGNLDLNSNSLLHWDILAPDINISSIDDLIWCKIVKSPDISEKHHIVHMKPLIQEGHEEFVFHIAMYECVGGTSEEFEDFVEYRGHECYHPSIPDELLRCQGIILGWIEGGGDIEFPEHAGIPIYPGRYYLFEVNYKNPELKTGIIDTSGIRHYYTPNLREYDAGVYAVGASISSRTFVPPGQDEYVLAGHSTPQCGSAAFPESGGKVFGILLHSRSLGRRMKLRHFRGNKELPPLAYDNNYDPSYQEYRYYKEEHTILQNDQLTRECTYNSSERSTVTLSAMTTRSEICVSLLLYYPFDGRYISHSGSSVANINRVLSTNITNEADNARVLRSYDWASVDIGEVQEEMRYSEQETQCYFGPFREGEETTLVSYPPDLIPYDPESTCSVNV